MVYCKGRAKEYETRAWTLPDSKRRCEFVRDGLDKERPWTTQEEWILICQHKEHGNSWTQIAECLEGRSESGTKNKWYSTKRAKVRWSRNAGHEHSRGNRRGESLRIPDYYVRLVCQSADSLSDLSFF
jgi:hypothetical protein